MINWMGTYFSDYIVPMLMIVCLILNLDHTSFVQGLFQSLPLKDHGPAAPAAWELGKDVGSLSTQTC